MTRAPEPVELSQAELEDRIQGGVFGHMLGNLNGLPREFKYLDEPVEVEGYTPTLPDGAFTDEDTDIECVYLREIQLSGQLFLAPERIVELWRAHIND